jgi:hypothetical protein
MICDLARSGRGKSAATKVVVGLTDQTLSCAARAHAPKPMRHDTRLHVRRAMRVACRRPGFDFTRRLGRRAEAGPRQLLRRVRPRRERKTQARRTVEILLWRRARKRFWQHRAVQAHSKLPRLPRPGCRRTTPEPYAAPRKHCALLSDRHQTAMVRCQIEQVARHEATRSVDTPSQE